MFWNAFSTFEASKAEVSMLDWGQQVQRFAPSSVIHQPALVSRLNVQAESVLLTESLGLLGRDGAQVPQVALVADEHDDNVRVGMVAELLEPAGDVDVGGVLCDVVDEQSPDGTAVVAVGERR